jgi:transcriptional regulator of acetoin/glycerol metabolism
VRADLISRLFDILMEALPTYQGGMEESFAARIAEQLRTEFAGDRPRIAKSELRGDALRDEIRRRWNGRNVEEIAEDLGVHRTTIYRALHYRPPQSQP